MTPVSCPQTSTTTRHCPRHAIRLSFRPKLLFTFLRFFSSSPLPSFLHRCMCIPDGAEPTTSFIWFSPPFLSLNDDDGNHTAQPRNYCPDGRILEHFLFSFSLNEAQLQQAQSTVTLFAQCEEEYAQRALFCGTSMQALIRQLSSTSQL